MTSLHQDRPLAAGEETVVVKEVSKRGPQIQAKLC